MHGRLIAIENDSPHPSRRKSGKVATGTSQVQFSKLYLRVGFEGGLGDSQLVGPAALLCRIPCCLLSVAHKAHLLITARCISMT